MENSQTEENQEPVEQNENFENNEEISNKEVSEEKSASDNEYITLGDNHQKDQQIPNNGENNEIPQRQTGNYFAIAQNFAPKLIESQERSFLDSIIPKAGYQEKDSNETNPNINFLDYINQKNNEEVQNPEEESEFFGFRNVDRRERKRSYSRSSAEPSDLGGGGGGGGYRFSYCCQKCKRNDKHGKTCVCVVPANQRKVQIGTEGCRSCGCKGCTREDMENKRGGDRGGERGGLEHRGQERGGHERGERGGVRSACCKDCLKQFSKTGKSCPCQVPSSIRKYKLPDKGCKYCGCHGCATLQSNENPRFHFKRNRKFSQSNRSSDSNSGSDSLSEDINVEELNLNNFDNSTMGNFLTSSLSIYPPLIGFGIPQRTASYILGKSLQY